MEPTDIEKKNLETHVDLCAQRYQFLEDKLKSVESKVTSLEKIVSEVHDMLATITNKRNDQIIGWGVMIIAGLIGTIGWLLNKTHFLN